ncbi:MAG: trimethylamine methyltransferase family protein [Candidatus Thorarchaeota archaeon]|nr:MAG: trimethylamine methyltransferase family protein [Candidatus Thorarchaeota archaeon]
MTRIKFLTQENIDEIHEASIEVLGNTGILIKNRAVCELLKNAGCELESSVVRIPSDIIDRCLKSVPRKFYLHNRAGSKKLAVGGDDVHYNPGSSALNIIDRETGILRPAKTKDLTELVHLVDSLEFIRLQSTAVVANDAPVSISDLYRLYIILKNSPKPIVTGAFNQEGLLDMIRLLEAAVGGPKELASNPRAIFDCCPSSPLMWSEETSQNLVDCAKHGVPAAIVPAPQIGANSPVTLSGTLIQSNAEILSGVVISQTVSAGAPIVYGGAISAFDMKYALTRTAGLEAQMAACGAAEIGKHYGIPTHAYLGVSDAKAVDAQAGLESGLGIVLAALARINIVSGPGMLAFENGQSLEKLVVDNDLCGAAYRLIEGIEMDNGAIVSALIDSVGPAGHFLSQKHTREHFRKEHFMPSDVIDRQTPESWQKSGSRDAYTRAHEIVEKILKEHQPTPLPEAADASLDEVLKSIAKRHGLSLSHIPTT